LREPGRVGDDASDMSASTLVFLAVRSLHVLLAATWLGTTAFIYLFLSPALDEVGAASAPVMAAFGRRGIHVLIASVGGITVLSGIWLYWHFTGGFDPAASGTVGARVFGAGGAAGILALILGGAIVGRRSKKMTDLAVKVASTTDPAQKAALMTEIAATKRNMSFWGKTILVLQVIALVCMAVGHYV
jgi:uncharacterized membrane protein